MTGDADLDFVIEAGPRAFTPDLPVHLRLEIAKSSVLGPYREACRQFAQSQVALMHKEIAALSEENRRIEQSQEFMATNGLGYPYYRKPVSVHYLFEELYGYGCWQDEGFVEDFLKHHPGLRIRTTRGTRGQEYAGKG
jgi:hypothetical protein